MDLSIRLQTIRSGWSFEYIEGSQVIISKINGTLMKCHTLRRNKDFDGNQVQKRIRMWITLFKNICLGRYIIRYTEGNLIQLSSCIIIKLNALIHLGLQCLPKYLFRGLWPIKD